MSVCLTSCMSGDGAYKIVRLPNFIWSLLQTSLSRVDPPVTVIDVLLHVAHIIKVEAPFRFLRR